MDFFSRQEHARRTTMRMLVYFALTILLLFAGVNAVLYGVALSVGKADSGGSFWWWHYWTPQALAGTLILVLGGALLEWLYLREGGKVVAEMMGGVPVDFSARDASQRRLLNVTEEMAIAAGLPVPVVYVMPREAGINAFVAGLTPQQSVLVVTQGALEHLERDELQGMVAHEFSHILHGDMRLNMRMLAALAGVLAIGQLGGFLMRSLTGGYDGRRERNPLPVVWLLGLAIWLVGYAGLFMGRLIKAAVSREREVLADAAGVQFTRNPEGLAGALWKIREQGSRLQGLHAETLSHLCFGESVPIQAWLATHPPLDERIEAICPGFLQRKSSAVAAPLTLPASVGAPLPGLLPGLAPLTGMPVSARTANAVPPPVDDAPIAFDREVDLRGDGLTDRVGELRMEDLESAAWLHRQIPVEITRALQTATGARAVLYALIARFQPMSAEAVQEFLEGQSAFARWVIPLGGHLATLDGRFALPLVELCLPRLDLLDAQASAAMLRDLRRFALQNSRLSVFEFALLKRVEQRIRPAPMVMHQRSLESQHLSVAVLVRCLLDFGSHARTAIPVHYQKLMQSLGEQMPPMPDPGPEPLPALDRALRSLRTLDPDGKRRLLALCARTVESDGVLHVQEYELLRVIAGLLDCPLPLLQSVIQP